MPANFVFYFSFFIHKVISPIKNRAASNEAAPSSYCNVGFIGS